MDASPSRPPSPIVVKIGGSTLGAHDTTLEDLAALQQDGVPLVVVHGGGSIISQWMEKQGTVPRFVGGLRVTDAASLEIATGVLAGLVNKQLVASLIGLGVKAVGMSGVDGGLLQARVANEELGYVGEITEVNADAVWTALEAGYMPMIAPIGMHRLDGSPMAGSLLNINGDTAAGELARALGGDRLIFLTDVDGILDGSGRLIHRLNSRNGRILLSSGVVKGGMIPKLQACLNALDGVQVANIVDGRRPGALIDCIRGRVTGTQLVRSGSSGRAETG